VGTDPKAWDKREAAAFYPGSSGQSGAGGTHDCDRPIFEADFLSHSFRVRPKKATQDAQQVLIDETWRGHRWVVETDIASCFEAIPHDRLMAAVEARVCDRHILKLLRVVLRAGVMEEGIVMHRVTATAQSGAVSPLLANIYPNQLDQASQVRGYRVFWRYADDLLVMCRGKQEAEQALSMLGAILNKLGLALRVSKTRIVHLREGGEGTNFLGFHHRWVRDLGQRARHLTFLARLPHKGDVDGSRPPSGVNISKATAATRRRSCKMRVHS
jgi:RNA-directed DNA polymerase